MPEEIKKVIVVALEGASGSEVYELARSGKMPNLQGLMGTGATVTGVAVEPSPAASLATLATGAHPATHGVSKDEESKAQYVWQAAEQASKRGLLLNYPASMAPEYSEDHPEELTKPASQDAAYFDQLGSYLLSSPDWDVAFARVQSSAVQLQEVDENLGKVFDAADFETMRVFVVIPSGEGDGLVVLDGPGIRRGAVVERPVELADVAPTVCYLAETPVPAECEGGIIYQALEDPNAKILELQSCRRNYERLRRSGGATPMC
ncbi:MAG: alkaline phosphatase family protein [Dehalococcoidales bacterium]|nr:alkaline phosphatase family protein [Dehalococcoidales bacterium]